MIKERIFKKTLIISNFRFLRNAVTPDVGDISLSTLDSGSRESHKDAEISAHIIYTPRGYCCDITQISPVSTWDQEGYYRIKGITEDNPEGDLLERNFNTALAAMHFITRKLKSLGWAPSEPWINI